MRERSYASEPGSRILLKLDDEKEKIGPDLGLASDHDEDDDTIECDLGMRTSTLSEPLDFGRRSQTLLEVVSLWSRDTCISCLKLAHLPLISHILLTSSSFSTAPAISSCRPAVGRTHLKILYKKQKNIKTTNDFL